jgi:hypothetical protein
MNIADDKEQKPQDEEKIDSQEQKAQPAQPPEESPS